MSKETPKIWTIRKVLEWTVERFSQMGITASPRLDAEVLLAHTLNTKRIHLYTDYDKPLTTDELASFRNYVRRRLAREPVAYIIGKREFWSLTLNVNPAVLIPRPETEILVETALALAKAIENPLIVDVGTGSGAIAIALALEVPQARVIAIDYSEAALGIARQNAIQCGAKITFLRGDLLDPLPDELKPQLIVSNPPYIPSCEIEQLAPEVKDWEPRVALDGGADGLSVIRRLISSAIQRLSSLGWLCLEIGSAQAASVQKLLGSYGFQSVKTRSDLNGLPRVTFGKMP